MPTHSGRADILAELITDVLFLIGQLATAERVLAALSAAM
jgi:hypothetical protein